MSEIKGLTILIVLMTLGTVTIAQDACIESRLCYCQNSDSTFIDLNPIGAKRLQTKKGLHTYELQLCEPFDLQGGCIGVYGCQIRQILPNYVSLGNTAHFTDSINITYTGGDSIAIVQLLCNAKEEEASLDFLKESPKKTFNFLLQSKYACPQSFPTTTAFAPSDSTQDTTQTDSTAEPGGSTTATSEATTGASESTAATSELTTEASEPTDTTSERTTQESEATTAASESTTGASGSTSEATATTTAASATTDTTPTTTHGGAGSFSTLTMGAILLLALLSRAVL
ncbi:unnamed protein product [Lymnaea stagnalis]|uniref:MRH domain-containing protein n=1 Tax=Lymnaea stagnalis TaxID=6523 RepID=A0AAV2HHZ8_LYMST